MWLQRLLKPHAKRLRLFDEFVSQRPKERGELLLRPVQRISRKQSSSRTKLSNADALRRTHHAPHLLELPCEQPPKHRMHITRCVEVASLSELQCVARVISKLRIIETQLHVVRERNWP